MTTSGNRPSYFTEAYRDYLLQNPRRKLDHYLKVIEDHRSGVQTLLDVGCGLGAFLGRARQRNPVWTLAGTDIDPEAVEATQALVPEATIRLCGADEAPFPAHSFDVITAWDVLEHVPDIEAARAAIHTMLKPGGLFVFVVPVYDGITGPVIRALDKDETHLHKMSRRFWLEWTAQGFTVLGWHGIFRYLVVGSYLHFPTSRLRRHSPAILVAASKS